MILVYPTQVLKATLLKCFEQRHLELMLLVEIIEQKSTIFT